ncbi:SDR family NAD(P)-dependent oxidoreductase [Alteromonas lipotrueae]|uniref:SDR family NAD(P)-dependent oxidoreductase n=1 Tax=Alteromonas lipotrueae TaxID=2803814 RepID=UPI001C460B2F|nr:SDR family NAD(P)-dependent oxidoreductase [Alteromonas lipotrueae]
MKVLEGTKGTKGIRLAAAKEFSIQGAKVFVTGRSQREVDNATNIIGNDVVGLQADSSNLAELDIVMSHVKHVAGHLDILVTDAKEGGCCSEDELSHELQESLAQGG